MMTTTTLLFFGECAFFGTLGLILLWKLYQWSPQGQLANELEREWNDITLGLIECSQGSNIKFRFAPMSLHRLQREVFLPASTLLRSSGSHEFLYETEVRRGLIGRFFDSSENPLPLMVYLTQSDQDIRYRLAIVGSEVERFTYRAGESGMAALKDKLVFATERNAEASSEHNGLTRNNEPPRIHTSSL
jgi:hypothetical protein